MQPFDGVVPNMDKNDTRNSLRLPMSVRGAAGILSATGLFLLAAACVAPARAAGSVDPLLARYSRAQQELRAGAAEQGLALPLPPLPTGTEIVDGRECVSVLLRGPISRSEVESLGGRVHTVAGDVMTVVVPLAALADLVAASGIDELNLAQPVELQSDLSLPEIGAPGAWGGTPPNFPTDGRTGRGVVLGVVDTGIDPGHADFKTASGTRILWLWDQNFGLGAPAPSGFSYGSEFSSSALDGGAYTMGDDDGHGTHIAGVAAGNGRATGNGVPMYKYMGVAPEADLIIVRLVKNGMGTYSDDTVIDGVSYVFQKAAALGRPAVVLLAVGKTTGPHDGNDPLDIALSNLTGPGKIIVAAAGNYGDSGRHAEATPEGMNHSSDVTISFNPYTPGPTGAEHFYSEAWYDPQVNHSISVLTPGGQTVGPVELGGTTTVNTPSGVVQISNGQYVGPDGSRRVNIYVYRGNIAYPPVAAGTWIYRVTSQTSTPERVDFWITDYALGGSTPVILEGRSDLRLVSSPATADEVISVGAYSTKTTWYDVNGSYRFYSGALLHDLADFSSPGPRRDDALVPHITAPGYGVGGAMTSLKPPSTMWILDDGKHRMSRGTSVAAAHVAGVVAMMLQAQPTLTTTVARERLQQYAVADAKTGAVPNPSWGAGKLRVPPTAPTAVDGQALVHFSFSPAYPNPSRGPASFEFVVPAEDLRGGAVPVQVRILDVRGREVARLAGRSEPGPQRLVWDGRLTSGEPAPAGIYLSRLEVGEGGAVRKFVRLR